MTLQLKNFRLTMIEGMLAGKLNQGNPMQNFPYKIIKWPQLDHRSLNQVTEDRAIWSELIHAIVHSTYRPMIVYDTSAMFCLWERKNQIKNNSSLASVLKCFLAHCRTVPLRRRCRHLSKTVEVSSNSSEKNQIGLT